MSAEESCEHDLVCVECGTMSTAHANGWRAYLMDGGYVAIFCPFCAEREFEDAAEE